MRTVSRRHFMRSAAALLSAAAALPVSAKASRPPNIVFILIDDMGWMDLSCQGSDFYETPHIDRLASQGMRFTDAYSACPVCSPTRASILTGKYPARLRLTDFIAGKNLPYAKLKIPAWTKFLDPKEVTIAERLKTAGYATACVGKWHLSGAGAPGGKAATEPAAQGFDFVHQAPTTNLKNNDPKSIDSITNASLDFIDKNQDGPFFLYTSHHAVHIKIEARAETKARYEKKPKTPERNQNNATYAGMVEHTDGSVARILDKLDALGLTRDTLVIFFSDNGGYCYGAAPTPTVNAPLRSGKGTLYEGGIRVPFIVRWPGRVRAGSVCAAPVTSVDFYPTLLEVAGAAGSTEETVDGVSLLPLLKREGAVTEKEKNRPLYWHYPHYHHTAPGGIVRAGDFKLIEYFEDGALELYNLAEDLGEQKNLAAALPEKTKELRTTLESWRASVKAQMPTPNPDYDPARADKMPKRKK